MAVPNTNSNMALSGINGATGLLDLPRELLPEIFFYLDLTSLCRVSKVCKLFESESRHDKPWRSLAQEHFPLFFDQQAAFGKSWREFFIAVKAGRVAVIIQVYDTTQVNCKDCYAAMAPNGNLHCAVVYHTPDFNKAIESFEINPNDPTTPVRPRPAMLAKLAPFGQLYTPPQPYSQYFKVGEEIELQWGAGYYWWRGVVEKIYPSEERMSLVFTHFTSDSSYYRETVYYERENGPAKGVRKITEEEKKIWRDLMTATGKNLWPAREEDEQAFA